MNRTPIERDLATLLPTHAEDLPRELLSLSQSLFAQSRSFSTSLKPEEEIARSHACAEIACKRLSRALKLPPLLGRPPCRPTVYKKLISFLDKSLSASTTSIKRSGSTSAAESPTRSRSGPATPTKEPRSTRTTPSKPAPTPRAQALQSTPSKSTPLKRSISNVTPQSRRKSPKLRANGLSASTSIPDAPAWVMTSIRTICQTLSTPAPRTNAFSRPPISKTLPPHIFAGVSSILHLIATSFENVEEELDEETFDFLDPVFRTTDNKNDEDPDFKEVVYALIVSIYFLALARRRNPANDDQDQDASSKKMDKKTFSEMRQTALASLGLPTSQRRHRDDVDQWIALLMEQGWVIGHEWFENIRQAGEVDGDEAYFSGNDDADGDGEGGDGARWNAMPGRGPLLSEDKRGGLLPGLGTMMQDRVDWLSEDRKEDFLEWKADMMERVEMMERGQIVA